jgi:hypothetical protein
MFSVYLGLSVFCFGYLEFFLDGAVVDLFKTIVFEAISLLSRLFLSFIRERETHTHRRNVCVCEREFYSIDCLVLLLLC